MLEVISSVPDIFNTGIYVVAQQSFLEVIHRAGIAGYFNNNINYKSHGTAISSSNNDSGMAQLQQNRADVAIQYTFALLDQRYEVGKTADEYQQTLSHIHNSNYKVIFHDPLGNITIIEYDRPLTITCNCVLYFNDLVGATDAQQRLQSIYTNGIISHDLLYSYFLPPSIYIRLYELYKFTNKEPSEFMQYITDFSGSRIVKSVNRHDNTDFALSVRKQKGGIVTNIEPIQGTPNPVGNEKSPNMYELSLSIVTQLSMSNLIGISYPIVLDNKLVPRNLIPIPDSEMYSPADINHPYFSIDKYFKLLAKETPLPEEPVHIPWYDKWVPSNIKILSKYKPFFISVVTLDDIEDEEGVTDIDLAGDLGGVTLIPSVIEAIKAQGKSSLYFKENVNISLFRNEILVEPYTLELIDETILRIKNRNTAGVYRLVISATNIIMATHTEIRIINADIITKQQKV